MPEGPEVKLSAEALKPLVVGKLIRMVNSFHSGRYYHAVPEGLEEFLNTFENSACTIKNIQVKGKLMYWSFSNDYYMLCTFGMTGQWSETDSKHTCIGIVLYDIDPVKPVSMIYFNDARHFGTIKFIKGKKELNKKLDTLGPDMLSAPPDDKDFAARIVSKNNKSIAEVLMNQRCLSGVGNYIKAEALYRAGISPWRQCNRINDDELKRLRQSIIDVMTESYAAQGATLATYKTVSGEEGSFASQLKVYGRNIDPYGNTVKSEETLDKRTSWWVPGIQK
ncbi:MAG TPA: DNA-formamidopyrimidine glycosylase family protein [Anaerovoracaceae bacterium]|nr:DNA-formamidopyrimidine glycosylase family protein [Anaerovoracaceae bacterium]